MERPSGDDIQEFRERHGLSQTGLAEVLGIGRSTLWRWETKPGAIEDAYEPHVRRLVDYMRQRDRRLERRQEREE